MMTDTDDGFVHRPVTAIFSANSKFKGKSQSY